MKIQVRTPQDPIPSTNDIDAIRVYYRRIATARNIALISCDLINQGGLPMVRLVHKYRAQAYAVTFQGILVAPIENDVLELLITATEDGITGVREALVLQEIIKKAGPSEQAQLAKNVIPIEWKFERYQPGTRSGEWAYVISDDEKYDSAYPDHPLTRVRRWLRFIEKTYRVIPIPEPPKVQRPGEPSRTSRGLLGKIASVLAPRAPTTLGGLGLAAEAPEHKVQIEQVPPKVMEMDEIVRELGAPIAQDVFLMTAFAQMVPQPPSWEVRQKICRDRREAELQKVVDRSKKMHLTKEATEKLVAQLSPDTSELIVPRIRASGHWLIQPEGSNLALAVFTNRAIFDNYVECKGLPSDPEAMSVRQLLGKFPELRALGINSLAVDRCPRCPDERPSFMLNEIPDEAKLLLLYALHVVGKQVAVQQALEAAQKEPSLDKRQQLLMDLIIHIHPGSIEARTEMAKVAVAQKDAVLFGQCRDHIAKYEPEQLPSLPEMPD